VDCRCNSFNRAFHKIKSLSRRPPLLNCFTATESHTRLRLTGNQRTAPSGNVRYAGLVLRVRSSLTMISLNLSVYYGQYTGRTAVAITLEQRAPGESHGAQRECPLVRSCMAATGRHLCLQWVVSVLRPKRSVIRSAFGAARPEGLLGEWERSRIAGGIRGLGSGPDDRRPRCRRASKRPCSVCELR
jgi:hypothetical protein